MVHFGINGSCIPELTSKNMYWGSIGQTPNFKTWGSKKPPQIICLVQALYVADVYLPAILGLQTPESLRVVTMNCGISTQLQPINSVKDLMNSTIYPDRFDCNGEFQKTHKLTVNPNMLCHIDLPIRTPMVLRKKIKNGLYKMVSQQIIQRIEEPKDWVSSLTYVTKQDQHNKTYEH